MFPRHRLAVATSVVLVLAACTGSASSNDADGPGGTGTPTASTTIAPAPPSSPPSPLPTTPPPTTPPPSPPSPTVAPSPASPPPPTAAGDLDPLTTPGPGPVGLAVELPDDPVGAPTVVLVHGGAWVAGSPDSLAPLAAGLADRGAIAVNLSYSTLLQGGGHPTTFDELACGIRQARAIGEEVGGSDELVLVGHSAGAHLAVVVALDEAAWGQDCLFDGSAAPDRFVGLAGFYDIDAVDVLMRAFLGGVRTELPDVWASVDPQALAREGAPGVGAFPVSLFVGDMDTVAPERVSRGLADELVAAGADATVDLLPGVDHFQIMAPSVSADLVLAD